MAIVTRGSAVKKNLKFFIWGEAGTWKSSLAMQLGAMKKEDGKPVRLLYVDAEYGSIDNYLEEFCEEYGVNPDNILIVKANTYDEIEEYLEKGINEEDFYLEDEEGNLELVLDAEGNKFIADAIVLDSATVIQDTTKYAMILTSEKRARLKAEKRENVTANEKFVAEQTAGMEFKDYDKLNHKGKNLLRSLITKTNKMVAVTSRQKDKKAKVKNSKGDFETVTVGVIPDCFKDAEYEFFTVLHTYQDEKTEEIYAQIMRKDRTGQFAPNHIIKNPTLFPWQDVIDGNKGKKAMKTEKKSYDEVVNDQAEQLQKKSKKQKNIEDAKKTSQEQSKKDTEKSATELFNEVKQIRLSLPSSKRSGLMSELTKAGLPKPSSSLSIEELNSILECAKKYADSIK